LLHETGIIKIDGAIVYQNLHLGTSDMEQYTSTTPPESDVNLDQESD
jgi:hypothetical protein